MKSLRRDWSLKYQQPMFDAVQLRIAPFVRQKNKFIPINVQSDVYFAVNDPIRIHLRQTFPRQ